LEITPAPLVDSRIAFELDELHILADKGYFSGAELLACHEQGITTLVPVAGVRASFQRCSMWLACLGLTLWVFPPVSLRAYQLDMTNAGVSATTFNVRIISLRFFFSVTCVRIPGPSDR
jgi:hypothetical protein